MVATAPPSQSHETSLTGRDASEVQHKYYIGSFRRQLKPTTLVGVMVTEADAVRLFPELARFALLPAAGWRFASIVENGQPACLVGWHNLTEATDALWIYNRADCLAVRFLADVPGASGGIVWDHTGGLASCVEELLALPDPSDRTAPRLVKAHAPSLWTP
jgi:hypothetical protein